MSDDRVFAELEAAVLDTPERSRNEAETRHKLIDLVIHSVLAWPRNRVTVEDYIRPGFADYVLRRSNGDPLILVEAKREGVFFDLPPAASAKTHSFISLKKLMSNQAINDAIRQVRAYCMDIGCEFAAITNGHEWIFFKTFERSKRWDELRAFVVRGLNFFRDEFTFAVKSFSYSAIVEKASLVELLTSLPPRDRSIYYPKDRITSFSRSVDANRLATRLRPLVQRYFGVIDDDDHEFMKRCYVSQRDEKSSVEGVRALIHDQLTPYFEEFGVKQLENDDSGGQLGAKITQFVKRSRKGEVLVLFGGKGAGKSTFIRRLLHHDTPKWLKEHSTIVILDLLNVPEDVETIRAHIWHELVEMLDVERVLKSDRDNLIFEVFGDLMEVAEKQDLAGLDPNSEAYNVRLNNLVKEWKEDLPHCATNLARNRNLAGSGVVVVLDNTDQYSGSVQDYCFTTAQEIADRLGCTVLISMREERFFNSKMHGVLDAFANSGFHISSPKPSEVFRKRVEYTIDLLSSEKAKPKVLEDSIGYLNVVQKELRKENSHLTNFLTACAHGDTRLSLDLFRSFLLSGYTNVDEILAAYSWDFQIHQVLKPVMIPNRFFYDENNSNVPNIFQLRYTRHCSHFTAMRILRKLAKVVEGGSPGYIPVAHLHTYFAETFNMSEDMKANLDILLKRGFVEARNRLDAYDDELDAIKITAYGIYMLNDLAYYFSYLDLVCVDCGVFDESVGNYLGEAAKDEYDLFMKKDRINRIQLRLDRVERFLEYLKSEEEREKKDYRLAMPEKEMFIFQALEIFRKEKERVMNSALRGRYAKH